MSKNKTYKVEQKKNKNKKINGNEILINSSNKLGRYNTAQFAHQHKSEKDYDRKKIRLIDKNNFLDYHRGINYINVCMII